MGSDGYLSEWHYQTLAAAARRTQNVIGSPGEKPRCKKKRHQQNVDSMEPHKAAGSYSFQHFTDTTMYIDDYRKKHTLANAGTDWKPVKDKGFSKNNHSFHESQNSATSKQQQYIDIRMPQRKICLTGLPQLKVPHNTPRHHATGPRDVDETRPFMADVPHLPKLKLNGISKKMKERKKHDLNDKERHRKPKGKKKKNRLPFLKPDINMNSLENDEDTQRNLTLNYPVL